MKRLLVAVVVVLALAPGCRRPARGLEAPARDPWRSGALPVPDGTEVRDQARLPRLAAGHDVGDEDRPVFLPQLTPIPMLHLGIGGPGAVRVARITMQQIANGQGDAYLLHLNKAIYGLRQPRLRAADGGDEQRQGAVQQRERRRLLAAVVPPRLRADLPHPPRRPETRDQRRAEAAGAPARRHQRTCRPIRRGSSG